MDMAERTEIYIAETEPLKCVKLSSKSIGVNTDPLVVEVRFFTKITGVQD